MNGGNWGLVLSLAPLPRLSPEMLHATTGDCLS